MHQTRQETTVRLPIPRKGTKYVARAASHRSNSVPVVVAVRDMLNLARTAEEVKHMIKSKLLKINGKQVKEYRESIKLFNLLEAGKTYELTLLPTNKFNFQEVKSGNVRLCKIVNKSLVKSGLVQINLHDGSNVITKDKVSVGDSLHLDMSGKIKKHLPLEKGSEVFIISGKYAGTKGKIKSIDEKLTISFKDKEAVLEKNSIIVI